MIYMSWKNQSKKDANLSFHREKKNNIIKYWPTKKEDLNTFIIF